MRKGIIILNSFIYPADNKLFAVKSYKDKQKFVLLHSGADAVFIGIVYDIH